MTGEGELLQQQSALYVVRLQKTCSSCFRPDLQVCFHPCAEALSMQQPYNCTLAGKSCCPTHAFNKA